MNKKWRVLPLSNSPLAIIDGDRGAEYPKKSDFHSAGDWLFLDTGNVRADGFEFSRCQFILTAKEQKLRKGRLSRNDIVLTTRGTIGNVGFYNDRVPYPRVRINSGMVVLRTDPTELLPEFMFHVVRSANFKAQIKALTSGAAQPQLPIRDIKLIEIPIPPRIQQEKIAFILGAYDDLIEVNRRRIALLEEMARRLFEEWFIRFQAPECNVNAMIETPIGRFPEGWPIVPIDDLCSRVTDGAHKSPRSIDAGVPMASVKDMRDWDFDLTGCRAIAQDDFDELARNDCKPLLGDILIAKDGSYLKHVFLVRHERDLAILSSIAILRPNGRMLPNLFIQFLRDPVVVQRMKGIVSGVAIPRIVLKDFKKFLIPLPPEEYQTAWDAVVGPMHQLCWQLYQTSFNLNSQRNHLLSRLMSGELSVLAAERELKAVA
jgi:type I restriction enzyme, S subunit